MRELHAVTGAFGYSGRYIASKLLDAGYPVLTLTNSRPAGDPFGGSVKAHPFHFEEPDRLEEVLRNVRVLYNTYWVRFNHRRFTHARAVSNSRILFEAARRAGVRRIVHVSITHPSAGSDLEYFRGKAELEDALAETGVSYAILRPTVLFGREDILINNIAWMLRRFPIFGVFGDGKYRLQPIFVGDLAALAVECGAGRANVLIDAVGPETFTYRGLVETIGRIIGKPRKLISIPPVLGYWIGAVVGKIVGDVVVTRPEIEGLMRDLLYVDSPPTGTIRLTEWAERNRDTLGVRYASELGRRSGERFTRA